MSNVAVALSVAALMAGCGGSSKSSQAVGVKGPSEAPGANATPPQTVGATPEPTAPSGGGVPRAPAAIGPYKSSSPVEVRRDGFNATYGPANVNLGYHATSFPTAAAAQRFISDTASGRKSVRQTIGATTFTAIFDDSGKVVYEVDWNQGTEGFSLDTSTLKPTSVSVAFSLATQAQAATSSG
jgi:hypothetical protein